MTLSLSQLRPNISHRLLHSIRCHLFHPVSVTTVLKVSWGSVGSGTHAESGCSVDDETMASRLPLEKRLEQIERAPCGDWMSCEKVTGTTNDCQLFQAAFFPKEWYWSHSFCDPLNAWCRKSEFVLGFKPQDRSVEEFPRNLCVMLVGEFLRGVTKKEILQILESFLTPQQRCRRFLERLERLRDIHFLA